MNEEQSELVDEMSLPALQESVDSAPIAVGNNAMLLDGDLFAQGQRAAKLLSVSALVPDTFKGSVPNCFLALHVSMKLSVDVFTLMQNMYVVHGKPSMEAKLKIAMANAHPKITGRLYPEFTGDGDSRACTASGVDAETGEICSWTVTVADAKAMGWWNKKDSFWPKMTDKMLWWRAAAWLIDVNWPDIALGLPTSQEMRESPMARPRKSAQVQSLKAAIVEKKEAPASLPEPPPGAINVVEQKKAFEEDPDMKRIRERAAKEVELTKNPNI